MTRPESLSVTDGGSSSSSIVTVAEVGAARLPFEGFEIVTVNVSFGSSRASSVVETVNDFDVSPALKLTCPVVVPV
jgi:hypothetical protein